MDFKMDFFQSLFWLLGVASSLALAVWGFLRGCAWLETRADAYEVQETKLDIVGLDRRLTALEKKLVPKKKRKV